MIEHIKKVGKHSIIYGIGSALSMSAGFILIPLYTNVLAPNEYGMLELLSRSADILMLVMFMGVRQAYVRFYFDKESNDWKKTVTSTTVIFVISASALISLAILPFSQFFSMLLFSSANTKIFVLILLIWLPFEAIFSIGLTNFQIQMRSLSYVLINACKFLLIILSNIVLVYFYRKGILGVLVTNLWVGVFLASCFIIYFIKRESGGISLNLMLQLIKFGLPYLPTAFFMFIICNLDRFLLKMFSDLEAVGIYALAYKIGMLGSALFMEPFEKVWAPFLFENYNKEDGEIIVGKFFTLFTLVIVFFCLAVSVGSPVLIPIISSKAYHFSYKLIPFICLASIFYGMACLADAGILIAKKTKLKPVIFGTSAIVSLVLNLLLIPNLGAMGATVALAATFFFLLILTYRVSSRFFPFIIEYKKIIIIFLVAAIIFFASLYLYSLDFKWLSLSSIFAFPLMLWISGYFSFREKETIKQIGYTLCSSKLAIKLK